MLELPAASEGWKVTSVNSPLPRSRIGIDDWIILVFIRNSFRSYWSIGIDDWIILVFIRNSFRNYWIFARVENKNLIRCTIPAVLLAMSSRIWRSFFKQALCVIGFLFREGPASGNGLWAVV
jgi:hypothetical protein